MSLNMMPVGHLHVFKLVRHYLTLKVHVTHHLLNDQLVHKLSMAYHLLNLKNLSTKFLFKAGFNNL